MGSKFNLKNIMKNIFGVDLNKWGKRAKYIFYGFLIVLVISLAIWVNRSSFKRSVRSVVSNVMDGLERKVTVYSYDGKEIKSWNGRFDIAEKDETNPGEVMFDMRDGRRVIITGGIIINETL